MDELAKLVALLDVEKWPGLDVLICLEMQCNKVSCTDRGCVTGSLLANNLEIPPLHYIDVRLDGPRKSKKTISFPAKNLLVSQEGLCSKERVNERVSPLIISIFIIIFFCNTNFFSFHLPALLSYT